MKPRRALLHAASLTLFASLVACGDTDGSEQPDPGPTSDKEAIDPQLGDKADSGLPPVVESGRFLDDGIRAGYFGGDSMPAYRVASFGNTKVQVTLDAVDETFDPVLVIDGPYPGSSPQVVAFNDDAGSNTMNSELVLTLETEGTYRLVVGSYAAYENLTPEVGDYELSFTCLENCDLPQLTLGEFVKQLQADHGQDLVEVLLKERAPALFEDPELEAEIQAQADAFLAGAADAEVFPVVPLSVLSSAQGFLEVAVEAEETAAPEPVEFNLDELVSDACNPDRGGPKALIAEIPDLQRGAKTDYRFDDCSLMRTQQLAEVLNNLALDNGSAIVADGERYTTVEGAVRALIEAGQHIEARNNRYYADFLGLSYKGTPVAAPLWVDTGIPLPGTDGNVVVPAPHAHYHFVIDGPLINGELMFYMGIPGGTAFRAHHTYRKPWAGERASLTRNTGDDLETVVTLLVTAGKLRKKWLNEGMGLPMEGYGQLGVCMDSTAVLELQTENTVTLFPLLHPGTDSPTDEVDDLLAVLPSEVDGTGAATAEDRLIASQPFDLSKGIDLQKMPFPTLKAQLVALGAIQQ